MKKTILIILSGIILVSLLGVGAYAATKKIKKKIDKRTPKIVMNTTRTGEIKKNEIWGGKIFVTGDIAVKEGVTLTILPGTIVTVAAFSDDQHGGEDHPHDPPFPKDPDRIETQSTVIMVRGRLHAVGTAAQKIVFTSDKKQTTYDWDGLNIAHGKLDYVIVEYARYNNIQESSDVIISHGTIRNSLECCLCIGHAKPVSPQILNNDIYNCGHEGIDNGGGSARIKGNYFHVENPEIQPDPSMGKNGVVIYQNSYPTVENNRFEKLSRAVYFLEDSKNKKEKGKQVIIKNNTIKNNEAAFGINLGYPMELVVRKNNKLLNNIEEEVREGGSLPQEDNARTGEINKDETWDGMINVTSSVFVKAGATLTIQPGTIVAFQHNRDYKDPDKKRMDISGTLKAIGTPDKPIIFTSDAADPQNGDWGMIHMDGKTGSIIKYAIIEFAQQGVNIWQSDATISHSIIRWNNWEGLYAESYSTPLIEYNRVYQNGYNGMAMEQFNKAIVRNNLFEKNGTHGLHIDASEAMVEGNIFVENGAAGISLDDAARVTATGNTMSKNNLAGFMCGEGENKLTATGNKIIPSILDNPDSVMRCPASVILKNEPGNGAGEMAFDYPDTKKFDLGYTPGNAQKDKYQYVYSDDETRRIVKKIGTGLGLTWSLAVDGKDVWTSTVSGDVYKLNGETGQIVKQFKVNSAQPWGMAFDGQNLWITDFAEKRTYSVDPETGRELFSFNNPDQERGAKGLAWDGQYLYIMGWTTNIIYQVDRQGKLMSQIKLKDIEAGGGLTWDGKNFWIPCGNRICKFDATGRLSGSIYVASEGTWDLAWEKAENTYGGYLWATQRTNENWHDDEKIFKLEIVNDQVIKN